MHGVTHDESRLSFTYAARSGLRVFLRDVYLELRLEVNDILDNWRKLVYLVLSLRFLYAIADILLKSLNSAASVNLSTFLRPLVVCLLFTSF